ncbi:MAG: isoleucine--tRNA ligase [Promethearchaeota archaeon]
MLDFYPELPVFPEFLKLEREVRAFWQELNVLERYLALNEKASEQFVFFDGPITANNPMGVHHAWGRTLKDVYLRYHTMRGKRARFQNGFDTQGLWVEVEVEKSLHLKSKKDINHYGLEQFRQACLDRVHKFGQAITEQSLTLGQWMDWENSYWTHTDNNIEHIWFFLKTCHDRGWLYKGHKVMPWCPRCGTSLSQHEQMDSYKELTHSSVYVAFSVLEPSGTLNDHLEQYFNSTVTQLDFLVWTTTPWTLPANVAVAVHPELSYTVFRSLKNPDVFLVLGEEAYEQLNWLHEDFTPQFTLNGKDLVGTVLEGPCQSFVPKQKEVTVRVVPWSEVSATEGTGLVHIAPGCGAEDYALGKEFNLHVLAPLDDSGNFLPDFGFDGKSFKEVSTLVREKLSVLEKLLHHSEFTHRYPVCWRCSAELVYRLVQEWFLSTEEIRPLLLDAVETVAWSPPSMKARMKNWLQNMGDWCISRKRFWGLPLPFYECTDCGTLQVFGRLQEFWRTAGFPSKKDFKEVVPDLHRPYLDNLTVPCSECGKAVHRITEVGDCWLDAGVTPFSTLNYLQNHSSNSYWAEWFPVDFVVEMHEQVRLWFYSLLFVSVTLTGKAPYKTVQAHEAVYDEKGEAMHRSKGNALWFYEAAQKLGVEPNRWFFATWDINKPLLYGSANIKESLGPLRVFWSCVRFLHQNLRLSPFLWDQLQVEFRNLSVSNPLDAWLVEELRQLSQFVHTAYEHYDVRKVVRHVSQFWDNVSRFWLRNSKERFWHVENKTTSLSPEEVDSYQFLWNAVYLSLQWLAPVVPHITEYLYQVVVRPVSNKYAESLHLTRFSSLTLPKLSNSLLDAVSLAPEVQKVVKLGRQLRQKIGVRNRYTLPAVWVQNQTKDLTLTRLKPWGDVIQRELNTQKIYFETPSTNTLPSASEDEWTCWLDNRVTEEQKLSWFQADVLRTVQFLRKQAQLETNALTEVCFESNDSVFLAKLLSSDFSKVLRKEALVDVVELERERTRNWVKKRVKGLEKPVFVFLKPL